LSYVLDISLDLGLITGEEKSTRRDLHMRASQVTWKLYVSPDRRTA
jgi:hypothetical protein